MSKHRTALYTSRLQLGLTIIFIATPFLFLLLLALFTQLTVTGLFIDFSISIWRLAIAYIIAVSLAWILALVFASGSRSKIALPLFDILQSFPTFAIVPIVVLTFGATTLTIIIFLVITVIWPILFSIVNALKLIKKEYHEVAEIYGLRGWKKLRYFSLPASIPGVVTGSMIGLGEGWEALVATEIIMKSKSGLGNFFEQNSTNGIFTALGILGLMLIIFSLNRLLWAPILNRVYTRMEE